MIGYYVNKLKSGLTLEELKRRTPRHILNQDWKAKKDDKIYKVWLNIPLEPCEICGRKPCDKNERYLYHYDALIYRHHIYPTQYYGNRYNRNTTRDKFCMVCGYCHGKIHGVIRRQLIDNEMNDEICLNAIVRVKQRWLACKQKDNWHGNIHCFDKLKNQRKTKSFLELVAEFENRK